jgi:glutathione synthase/RimK-type ligase-like ATP-grasp enzyme
MVDESLFERLREGTTPVLVQAYVEGTDVRVHVVDREWLGTASRGLDPAETRAERVSYRAHVVPSEIAKRCVRFARRERLLLSGFDFRVMQDGTWVCLEANPMPSFIAYQWATGQPIAETLLRHFTAA